MIHLWSLKVLSSWGLPPTLLNPSNSSFTSPFLLPLLPCCPALSSQNPSPINPSFSSLVLPFWRLKRGISGIARTLIFDHLYHPLFLSLVSVSWLRGFLPYRHCWRLATLEAFRDQWTCYCTANIHSCSLSRCKNTHVFVLHTVWTQAHLLTETNCCFWAWLHTLHALIHLHFLRCE